MVDTCYQANISAIRCYPNENYPPGSYPNQLNFIQQIARSPVRNAQTKADIILAWDERSSVVTRYTAYVVPCDVDWTPLVFANFSLRNQALDVRNFTHSADGIVPYVHYQLNLPTINAAGNYVIVVHHTGKPNLLALSARFVVHSNQTPIRLKNTASFGPKRVQTHHRLSVQVDLKGLEDVRPFADIQVIIRQNRRWKTQQRITRPTHVRDQVWIYDALGIEFCASQPFRVMDVRRLRFANAQIQRWERKPDMPFEVFLKLEQPVNELLFTFRPDIDGQHYFFAEFEPADTEAIYLQVHHRLKAPQNSGPWYVVGNFNRWQYDRPLEYDTAEAEWTGSQWVKQGYYEYLFSNPAGETLTGCAAQSDNTYEAIVYVRDRVRGFFVPTGYAILRASSASRL